MVLQPPPLGPAQLEISPCKPCPRGTRATRAIVRRFPSPSQYEAVGTRRLDLSFCTCTPSPYLHTAAGARSTCRSARPGWCSGWRTLPGAGTRGCKCMSQICRRRTHPSACPCASRWECLEAAHKGYLQRCRIKLLNSKAAPKCLKSLSLWGTNTCPRDGVTTLK